MSLRITIKADEKRKEQLVYLATGTKSIDVIGKYYKGCKLIKVVSENKTQLIVL